jgi:hypothetical protein
MTQTRGSRASMLLSGMLLMLLAIAGAAVGVQPAIGQEDGADEDPMADESMGDEEAIGEEEPAPSEDEVDTQDLEIVDSAVYAHPLTDGIPPTVADSVPPQAVCVVQPELCPEELRPLTGLVEDLIGTTQDEMEVSPVQPLLPETIAVGYAAGHERYESAIRFELPDLPEDEEITSFQLYLPVGDITYDLSSPTFRDIVTSVFVMVDNQDPQRLAENLADNLAEGLQGELLDLDNDFLRMEACALTQPFDPSEAPEVQHRDEMPREEPFEEGELGEPAADCMLGGTGVLDEDGEHWVFDLTFAADAWASGEIDNHGLLISPAGVPNLAFGDPDSSTFSQASLDTVGAAAVVDTAEPPPPVGGLGDLDDEMSLEDPGEPADPPAQGEDLGAPDSFDDSGAAGDDLDQPEVADSPDMDEPAAAEPVDGKTDEGPAVASPAPEQATPAASGQPAPWTWLLVPVFAGGAWLVTRSLTAPVAAAAAGSSGGAMSRLIASRGGPTLA